jgi:hypothetical protein
MSRMRLEFGKGRLHCQYQGQINPQPIYAELDPENRTVMVDYSGEIGNAVPVDVWNGRVLRWILPTGTTKAMAREWYREAKPMLKAICNEHNEQWNGSNWIGSLSEKGRELEHEIELSTYTL